MKAWIKEAFLTGLLAAVVAIFVQSFLTGCVSWQQPATPSPTPSPSAVPTPPPSSTSRAQIMQGWLPDYDAFIKETVASKYPALLSLNDAQMSSYCPAYPSLSKDEKLKFWTDFLFALAKPESSHHRALIYREGTMDTDPITGVQVRSEGLFQLSYQDKNSYPGGACSFNWEADKIKALAEFKSGAKYGDGTRSIHDAYKNMACTIDVIHAHLTKYAKRSDGSFRRFQDALGSYWYVMKAYVKKDGQMVENSSYKAVRAALVTRTSVCKSANYF